MQKYNNEEPINADMIARGIRKADNDKTAMGCLAVVALFVAILAALFTHWIVGVVIFVVLAVWIGSKFDK